MKKETIKKAAAPKKAAKRAAGYYTEKIINKFRTAFFAAVEIVKAGGPVKVSISDKNGKMGFVGSVSLLPFLTCPGRCATTCGRYCYAAKLANLRPSVLASYAMNTAICFLRPDLYWIQVKAAAAAFRFFRFHVSGDIPTKAYFSEMVKTALDLPGTKFLAFTKRFEIVNAWIAENGPLPDNLKILFSGEENLDPINPYDLPETTVYENDEQFINSNWIACGGNCFNCGCAGCGCWNAGRGDTVAFKKH